MKKGFITTARSLPSQKSKPTKIEDLKAIDYNTSVQIEEDKVLNSASSISTTSKKATKAKTSKKEVPETPKPKKKKKETVKTQVELPEYLNLHLHSFFKAKKK